jgi:hypothetical protein
MTPRRFLTEDGYSLWLHADGLWRDVPEDELDRCDLTFDSHDDWPMDDTGQPLSGRYID